MRLITTVKVQLSPEETEAWKTLFDAISCAAHSPCEDFDTAEAINNFYEAMINFNEYLED